MSDADRKALQRELGVTADGIWGPNTSAAYNNAFGGNAYGDGYNASNYSPVTSDTGSIYSRNGYTGEKIYSNVVDQGKYYELQDDLASQYLTYNNPNDPNLYMMYIRA